MRARSVAATSAALALGHMLSAAEVTAAVVIGLVVYGWMEVVGE